MTNCWKEFRIIAETDQGHDEYVPYEVLLEHTLICCYQGGTAENWERERLQENCISLKVMIILKERYASGWPM